MITVWVNRDSLDDDYYDIVESLNSTDVYVNLVLEKIRIRDFLRLENVLNQYNKKIKVFELKNSPNITRLPNLDFSECEKFKCIRCPIESLPNLPNVVELECRYCSLKTLPNLPNCKILICSFNQLLFLPNLPKVIKLYCSVNNLTTVGKINDVIETLYISDNPMDGSYKMNCAKILRDNPTIKEFICNNSEKSMFKSVPQEYLNIAVPELAESESEYESVMAKKEFIDYVNNVNIYDEYLLIQAIQVLYDALLAKDYQIHEVKDLLTSGMNLEKLEKIFKGIIRINEYKKFDKELKNLISEIQTLRMKEAKTELEENDEMSEIIPYLKQTEVAKDERVSESDMTQRYLKSKSQYKELKKILDAKRIQPQMDDEEEM